MKQSYRYFLMVILIVIFGSGCTANDIEPTEERSITIAAASDLALAFSEVGDIFEEETGVNITFSFGSTGQLADQIVNGAPFDIFAAANIDFVDSLREQGLIIPDTQTTYAFGRIGIATRPDFNLVLEDLEELLNPDIRKVAIANPDHAPYGLAAKQAFETAGIWDDIKPKLVYGRNISDTLAFIETGNAEAGIIALSLYQEGKVNFRLIAEDLHAPLEQSIAVINRTGEEQLAREFIEFIKGPIGKPIMESYGFIVPED